MSDREAWITFAAHAYAAWVAAGDYRAHECQERAIEDADALLIELNKRHPLPASKPTVVEDGDSRSMVGQPDEDGWIKWEGGKCPVDGNLVVSARFRDGGDGTRRANSWRWARWGGASDIVAYKVVA